MPAVRPQEPPDALAATVLLAELERHKVEAARLQAQIEATPLRRLRRLLTGGS